MSVVAVQDIPGKALVEIDAMVRCAASPALLITSFTKSFQNGLRSSIVV
jgi:hypothetical protein